MTSETVVDNADADQARALTRDLQQSRAREAALRRQADALLAGVEAVVGSKDVGGAFENLLHAFKSALDVDDAFILAAPSDGGPLSATLSTHGDFSDIVFERRGSFARGLEGASIVLPSIAAAPEWRALPPSAAARVQSVIMTPVRANRRRALLVGVSRKPGAFDGAHQSLLERLAHLARRAVIGLERREQLSRGLERIALLINNAPYDLLTIEPGLKIGPQHSATIGESFGLGDRAIAGAPIMDVMKAAFQMTPEQADLIAETLDVSIGGDTLNWELNHPHLPREMVLDGPEPRLLELLWTPMICSQADIVCFVLLSLRDVTQERAVAERLANEAQERKEMLDNISTILRNAREQVSVFFADARPRFGFLARSLTEPYPLREAMAREIHTLKGAARYLEFVEISGPLHELEDLVRAPTEDGAVLLDLAPVREAWSRADEAYRTLQHVFFEVLGGEDATPSTLSTIAEPHFADARTTLAREGVCCTIRIADALGAAPPNLAQALSTALQHLVVNMVDHSILPARRADGRRFAEISLDAGFGRASDGRDLVAIRLADDGAGFDREKIRRRALDAGFSERRAASLDVVFAPGFSTAGHVDLRSGRGIGMAAAQSAIDEVGGWLKLSNRAEGGSLIDISVPLTTAVALDAAS